MTYQKFSFLFDIYEMGRYTLEQNWEILKTYFQVESSIQTVRNLRGKFGRKEMPSTQFVDQFVKRIRQTESLLDKATRSRARPVRSTLLLLLRVCLNNHQHQLAIVLKT